ncbi:MAG: glycoside hydrolase family 15 protein [Longimicrobiales bacterium]
MTMHALPEGETEVSTLDLGVIGNCQIGALVDPNARIVWGCLPRFDGDPVFCSLLGGPSETPSGFTDVLIEGQVRAERRYLPNTAILETTLFSADGSAVRIVDFAPRFRQFDRMFHPVMIVRQLVPVAGAPRVTVRSRPLAAYGAEVPTTTQGSNHIRYVAPDFTLRLTTDCSISAVLEETTFQLNGTRTLIFGPDDTLRESPGDLGHRFRRKTEEYWQGWTRGLWIPFEWQDAVIRAAITLKMCTYEDTGAVIAAMTTSIPEAADSGRNWDYRYCWLRDSYFVVRALNRLGTTKTMEAYLGYLMNVDWSQDELQPLYGITGASELVEWVADALPGFRGMGPVRVGNEAYVQSQHDIYGAMVLSAMRYFFDQRLAKPGDLTQFRRLEELGVIAADVYDKPDAGLWEFRGRESVHTFSAVMCWAACHRLGRIARHLGEDDRAEHWGGIADTMHAKISTNAWNDELGSYAASFGGSELDASLLMLHELGFVTADDPKFVATVETIGQELKEDSFLFRYKLPDDFGTPETTFNICTFWYINALAAIGRLEEARVLFERMLECRTSLGLMSEDLDHTTLEPWGNFPQTYSMAGIINVATRLSISWDDAL